MELVKQVAKVSARNDRSATEFVAIPGRRDHLSFDMRYMWKRHLPRRNGCKKHVRDVRRGETCNGGIRLNLLRRSLASKLAVTRS